MDVTMDVIRNKPKLGLGPIPALASWPLSQRPFVEIRNRKECQIPNQHANYCTAHSADGSTGRACTPNE